MLQLGSKIRSMLAIASLICLTTVFIGAIQLGPALAQSAPLPTPYVYRAEILCGMNSLKAMASLSQSIYGEEDAEDWATEVTNSRSLIELADKCLFALSRCDPAGATTCNESKVWITTYLSWGQYGLAHALAGVGNSSNSALENEIETGLDLCESPDITATREPFIKARNAVRGTLLIASKVAAYSDSPAQLYLDRLRACAERISDFDVTF